RVERHAELLDERRRVRADEAEREDQRVDRDSQRTAIHVLAVQRDQPAALTFEVRRAKSELPRAAFFLRARGAEYQGPARPGVVRSARLGRCRHQLDLHPLRRALAMCRAEAVRPGITTAQDHDALAAHIVLRRRALAAVELI